MKKTIIIIVVLAVLAIAIYYFFFGSGSGVLQNTFSPEGDKVYQWKDEKGVTHFSDSPVYVPNPDKKKKFDMKVKKFEDYGKGKIVREEDVQGASSGDKGKSESASSKEEAKSQGSANDKEHGFIKSMRKSSETIPDSRTNTEKVIHGVPSVGGGRLP